MLKPCLSLYALFNSRWTILIGQQHFLWAELLLKLIYRRGSCRCSKMGHNHDFLVAAFVDVTWVVQSNTEEASKKRISCRDTLQMHLLSAINDWRTWVADISGRCQGAVGETGVSCLLETSLKKHYDSRNVSKHDMLKRSNFPLLVILTGYGYSGQSD